MFVNKTAVAEDIKQNYTLILTTDLGQDIGNTVVFLGMLFLVSPVFHQYVITVRLKCTK